MVQQFIFIEFVDFKLGIPPLKELMLVDDFGDGQVGEGEGLVEQLAEGSLAGAGSAGH